MHPPTTPTLAGRAATPAQDAPPCGIDDLSVMADGWEAAMGNRWATLTATNMSATACLLNNKPSLRVIQRTPLQLNIVRTASPGSLTDQAAPPRVLLPPRAGATATLWWRGYGAAADQHTPQRLALRFGSGDWRTVPLTADEQVGVAPFDLVDGGEVELGPWRPFTP